MFLLDSDLTSYLHLKCIQGDHFTVADILEEDPTQVHSTNGRISATPIYYATRHGHFRVVEVLLKYGALVNVSIRGWAPLHESTFSNRAKIVKLLLDHGADPNAAVSYSGKTPLMQAARNGAFEVCEILLEAGANVWLRDVNGRTAADVASSEKCRELILRKMRLQTLKKYRDSLMWGSLPDGVFEEVLEFV